VTDLAQGPDGARRAGLSRRSVAVALPALVAGGLSLAAYGLTRTAEWRDLSREFEHRARGHASAIRTTIEEYRDILHSIDGLFSASQVVGRQAFREFVTRALARHAGIRALAWIPRVPDSMRAAVESAARAQGLHDYRITEQTAAGDMVRASRRAEYFPVYFLEPRSGNEQALGFDLASSPARREALERARDTGSEAVTPRITLVTETGGGPAFLLTFPIYRRRALADTLEGRRRNLIGFAVGAFRIGDVIEASLKELPPAGLDLDLLDRSAPEGDRLLYVHRSRLRAGPGGLRVEDDGPVGGLQWSTTLEVGGRQWTLRFRPAPEFLAARRSWHPWGVLAGGLLLTALLVAYLASATGQAARAERLVRERTADLTAVNQRLRSEIDERSRVERALRDSEERHRLLLESSPDPIAVYDAAGGAAYVNPAFVTTFGWSLDGLQVEPMAFVPEDDRVHLMVAIERARRGQTVRELEVRGLARDGRVLAIQLSASPLRGTGAAPAGVVITLRDISERRRTAEALRRSQEAFAELVDSIDGIVWEADARTFQFVFVSRQAERLLGYPVERWISEATFWQDHLHPADREWAAACCASAAREGRNHDLEYRMVAADGRVVWVRDIVTVVVEEGQPVRLRGVMVDVTAQKQAAAALQESEERYRDLVEHSEDLIWTHELAGTILSANRALVRQLGYARQEEILGRSIADFLAPDARQEFEAYRQALVKDGRAAGLMKVVTKTGVERFLEYQNSLRTEGVHTPVVRALARDVTERVRVQQALARRTAQMQLLREISIEIAKELDLASLTALVCRRAAELLESACSVAYLWDERGGRLDLAGSHGLGAWAGQARHGLGEAVAEATARERKGLRLNDYRASSLASAALLERTAVVAAMTEPLLYRGRLIGVLVVYRSSDGFEDRDQELLNLFAAQAAIAIENARLYSALGESRSKLEELIRMGSAMQEPLSLQERLALVLTAAQGVLGFDRINILLADPDRTMLRSVASVGVDEPIEQIRVPLGREGGGIARAFVERRPVVWDGAGPVPPDWRLAPPYSEIGAFRSRSFVNLPLLVRGEAIGVLGADNKFSRRPPSPEIVRLLQVFAAQAAVAIENARLYEEVAGYARELEQRVEERTRALKEAQAKLIQSAKLAAVGTLAAGVAHELNQPLMVIRGYAQELLAGGRRSFEEMREDLGRIEAQTSRMAAIIGQLMEFSRRSEGRRGLTDLNEVVFQALALLGQQVRARNIVLTQDLQPGLPPVWADPLQLEQVLVNLITNARDAMEVWGRGVLQVRTRAAGDGRVAVSVTDSGPGIPPHLLKRIFDPFFTTKEVGKGTGLGLSICHGIVEEHGGEILVESPVAEGRGARFTVLLPAAGGDGRGERR